MNIGRDQCFETPRSHTSTRSNKKRNNFVVQTQYWLSKDKFHLHTDFTYFVPHESLRVPLPELPQALHPWGEGRGRCWTSLPQKPYLVWNFQPQHPKESWEVKTTINPVDELFVANRIKYFHKPLQCCSLGWDKSTLGNTSTGTSTSYCIFNLLIPLKASGLALKKTQHDKLVLFQKISFLSVPLKFYLSR